MEKMVPANIILGVVAWSALHTNGDTSILREDTSKNLVAEQVQKEPDNLFEFDSESLRRAKLLLSDVNQLIEKYGQSNYKIRRRNFTPKPPSGTSRRKVYYQYYVRIFGEDDEEKMKQLNAFRFGIGDQSICYLKAYTTFLHNCHYAYYERGGLKPMRRLIANACDANWLNLDKINDILQRTCKWKFQYILPK